jgi:hypothetical protein
LEPSPEKNDAISAEWDPVLICRNKKFIETIYGGAYLGIFIVLT